MRPMRTTLCLLALASASVATAQFQFSYDNTELLTAQLATNAVAIVDVDLDGHYDLVFANGGSDVSATADPQHLFLNSPGSPGNFSDASANLAGIACNARMVIAEDLDLDGDPDLVFATLGNGQKPRIMINQGGAQGGTVGQFLDDTANRFPSDLFLSSHCVAGGDVDDDGDTDLVFTDSLAIHSKRARLLVNDGSGDFSSGDVTLSSMPNDAVDAHDVVLFDFDGDFALDIVLAGRTAGKYGRVYINDGSGVFSSGLSNCADGLGSSGSWETDWADLDGDGDWDASVTALSGANEGWGENLDPFSPMPETAFSGTNGQLDREIAHLDYDDDGDLDVFVAQAYAGGSFDEKAYAYNSGGGTFSFVNNLIEHRFDRTRDMGIRDLDGDGMADLVTAQWNTGGAANLNKIYVNNGAVGGADDTPPAVLALEEPLDVSSGGMTFRIHVQDAIVDDGKTNVTVDYTYCVTTTGCACMPGEEVTGTAFHQGGAMYRLRVPTDEDTVGVEVTWTITDDAGNVTETVVVAGDYQSGQWCDLGFPKLGVNGYPALSGTGPLTPGSINSIDLTNSRANTVGMMVYGFDTLYVAVKGGVLVPDPWDIFSFPIGGSGSISLPFQWPTGFPGGLAVYYQVWIQDEDAANNLSASNGLRSVSAD